MGNPISAASLDLKDNPKKTNKKIMRHQDLTTLQPQGEYFAAVDMGSNSFHLVVVHVVNGNVQVVSKVKQKVQLAAGLDAHNILSKDAMQRGWNCLHTFADRLKDIPASNIKVVATATLRLAGNAQQFVLQAEQILEHKITIISGLEEAEEIYRGVAFTSATKGNTLVIDIGGASTEVVLGRDAIPIHLHSFNMGCVTFTEQFFPNGTISEDAFAQAIESAKKMILPHLAPFKCFDLDLCLGASGTPQAIIEILQEQGNKDAIRLNYLHELRRQCTLYNNLQELKIIGLAESRQAIFPSGLAILIALFESFDIDSMNLAGGALREGLIYGMIDDQPLDDRRNQTITRCIKQFHIQPLQAQQVAHTALSLYQQFCEQSQICSLDSRTLLHTAAMLHEIGMHIGYKNQHAHAQYILMHHDLAGFTKLQKECIAAIVGNHKGDIAISCSEGFPESLSKDILAMIRVLRIATILHIKRNHMPSLPNEANIKLLLDEDNWTIKLDQTWLSNNKLVQAELANEAWLQHKAKWHLAIETTKTESV